MSPFKLLLLSAITLLAYPTASGADSFKGVIVFHQPEANDLEDTFVSEYLPAVQEAAKSLGYETRALDAREGAPAEIGMTPLLVFQNHRGRSIFQGRYADPGKVRHFILTSRHVPQGDAQKELNNVGVWRDGRMQQIAEIKITQLEGTRPESFDETTFHKTAREAVSSGLSRYETKGSVTPARSDRTFYYDFHPWRGEDGTLYVSSAIFSQFNCHVPVWRDYEGGVSAPWTDWPSAFEEAAANLQAEVVRLRGESDLGDGYTPVSAETSPASWNELNLEIPEPPQGTASAVGGTVETMSWTVDESLFETDPPVQFSFMAPLDNYQGIAKEAEASLILDDNRSLANASGSVQIPVDSITLGESGLDLTVINSMLKAGSFPKSSFDLEDLGAPAEPLAFGKSVIAEGTGTFMMRDQSIPLGVRTEILPIFNEAGEPRLDTTTSFSIRLMDTWAIEGPPGPSPANDTLEFLVRLTLKPAESSPAG